MILNSAQIQTLLAQGAITQAQAQSLAASNQTSVPTDQDKFIDHSAMNVPIPKDGGQEVSSPEFSRPPAPPPTPISNSPTQNVPPPPDQSQEMLARAQATGNAPLSSPGGFNAQAYQQSLAQNPTLQVAGGAPAAARGNPAIAAPPPLPNTSDLKGTNSLSVSDQARAAAGQAMAGQGGPQVNNPATLYMPQGGGGMDLSPEKKLLKTTNTLGGEQVGQLGDTKGDQAKINEMQQIAGDTAGNIALQQAAASSKEVAENKAAWDAAMKRADQQSADIVARAREIGNRKVDPNRYWNSMDKGSQFMAGLMMAFGAVGSGMLHTQNYAFERMQNAIKMDVDAQKTDIDNAYKGLGIEQDAAHSDLQRSQLDAAFRDKQVLQHWEVGKIQAQGMLAKLQAPIDKKRGDMLLNNIDDQIRQTKLSMANNLYNFETLQRKANAGQGRASETEVRKYVTDKKAEFMEKGDNEQDANDRAVKLASERFGLGMKGGEATLPTLEDDKTKDNRMKKEALMVNLPTGQKAEARSESAANEYNKRQMAIGQLASIARRMKEIRDRNHGGTLMNRADIGEARSLQEQAVNQYNEITGFNRAPGQPERTGLKGEVIPDVTDYSPSGAVDRKLASLTQFVNNAHNLNNRTYLKEPPQDYDVVAGKPASNDNGFAAAIGAQSVGR
jgi:hypothetical protein